MAAAAAVAVVVGVAVVAAEAPPVDHHRISLFRHQTSRREQDMEVSHKAATMDHHSNKETGEHQIHLATMTALAMEAIKVAVVVAAVVVAVSEAANVSYMHHKLIY